MLSKVYQIKKHQIRCFGKLGGKEIYVIEILVDFLWGEEETSMHVLNNCIYTQTLWTQLMNQSISQLNLLHVKTVPVSTFYASRKKTNYY